MPLSLTPAQVESFTRDGFVAPVRVMPAERAAHYRRALESFEANHPNDQIKLDQKAHMICPWITEMIREPGLLDATEDLLGRICCAGARRCGPRPPTARRSPAGIKTLRTPTSSRSC